MINIVYAANDRFFNQIFLSVLSMLKHNKEQLNIRILTLDCVAKHQRRYYKVTEEQRNLLEMIIKDVNEESTVELIDMGDIYDEFLRTSKNHKSEFTPFSMLRLLLPKLKLNTDKILYLDTDTMFLDDVSLLYNMDIKEYDFAAVQDAVGHHFFGKRYINTGVMLINYNKIIENEVFDKSITYLNKHFSFMPDQDAINKASKAKLIIPRRFNEQKDIKPDTVIKHFCNQPHFFPYIRVYKYKQTQVDKVHDKLKIFDFDDIYESYYKYLEKYPNELS